MDLITLTLAKNYANKVAAGFSNVVVDGSNIKFTLNDGSIATVTIPTPADGKDGAAGISVTNLTIDADGSLLCHMSDGSVIDAGFVPTVDPDLTNYYTKEESNAAINEVKTIAETNQANLYIYQQETELALLDLNDNMVTTKDNGYDYTYDGNYADKTTAANQFVKISDDILTEEDLIGAMVTCNNRGEDSTSIITELTKDTGTYLLFNTNDGIGTICSVYTSGGFYPETGLYVSDLQMMFKIKQYVKSITKKSIQTIEGAKNFTGGITKNGKNLATEEFVTSSITTGIATKVDKVTGKGLSTEDFTTELKTKLEGLNNYNDTEIKSTLNSKANSNDVYTKSEIDTKLGTIESLLGGI